MDSDVVVAFVLQASGGIAMLKEGGKSSVKRFEGGSPKFLGHVAHVNSSADHVRAVELHGLHGRSSTRAARGH